MSHHPLVFSPAGTPWPDRTVGELVAERPNRSRVFQALRLDFCCQGGRTLREACAHRGWAVEEVIAALEAADADVPVGPVAPAGLPLAELIAHIVEAHHGFLRRELPRLHAMAKRVARVHGGHTPSLIEVLDVFRELFLELDAHMGKEEQILFPMIVALDRGEVTPMPVEAPITQMVQEHDDAGDALERLRRLTGDYRPPAEACNTYRALFAGLEDLERDMHRHIHLENHVLFPRARALEIAPIAA